MRPSFRILPHLSRDNEHFWTGGAAAELRFLRCRACRHWIHGFDPPYAVAIVELDEQPGLRLTTNVVGCEPDQVAIGMRVRVTFEERDGVHVPLFEPEPR